MKTVRACFLLLALLILQILISCHPPFGQGIADIYVQFDGTPINEGNVFTRGDKGEFVLNDLRSNRPCFEISWTKDGKELDCSSNFKIVDYGDGKGFGITHTDYALLKGNDTVLKIIYYPVDNDPVAIENIPLDWYDVVAEGSYVKFVADFKEGTFVQSARFAN